MNKEGFENMSKRVWFEL